MRISYWSSDVCSSDLFALERETLGTIPDDVCLCSYRFPIIKARNVQVAPDCVGYGFRQLRCTTPHERCCNARIGCEPIEMLGLPLRSEEHTSELQSLMRISYAVFCLKKKKHETK